MISINTLCLFVIIILLNVNHSLGDYSECRIDGEAYTGTQSYRSDTLQECLMWSLFDDFTDDDNYCKSWSDGTLDPGCIVEEGGQFIIGSCAIPVCSSSETSTTTTESPTDDGTEDVSSEDDGNDDSSTDNGTEDASSEDDGNDDSSTDNGTEESTSEDKEVTMKTDCGVISEQSGESSVSDVLHSFSGECGQRQAESNDKRSTHLIDLLSRLLNVKNRVSHGTVSQSTTNSREWPWMVFLTTGETDADGNSQIGEINYNMCGASMISDQWVMTAAHCVETVNNQSSIGESSCHMKLYLGEVDHSILSETEWDEITATAAKVVIHSDYDTDNIRNDIALIKLPEQLVLDQKIHGTPCFAEADNAIEIFKDSTCYVAGWGTTEEGTTSNVIKHVQVTLLSDAVCKEYVDSKEPQGWQSSLICAGTYEDDINYSSCGGDSGGALFCDYTDGRYYQIGIVSYGHTGLCGDTSQGEIYGVYTDVLHYNSWINYVVDNN